MTVDGREAPLEPHLAERLAEALGLPAGDLSGGSGLNDVAMACAVAGRYPTSPYSKLKSLLDEMGPELRREPPPALRQLAEITDFTLYVSTTFEGLLYDALALARAALAAYEKALAIRERLAAQDPGNAGWQRDLAVS